MATRNRLWSFPSSVESFVAQTHKNKTLCIYNDGETVKPVLSSLGFHTQGFYYPKTLRPPDISKLVAESWTDERNENQIFLIENPMPEEEKLDVHIKWNRLMCDASQGDMFAIWDDDDYFAPTRLEKQLRFLQEELAFFCAAVDTPYFNLSTKEKVVFIGHEEKGVTKNGPRDFIDGSMLWRKVNPPYLFDETTQGWNAVAKFRHGKPDVLVNPEHGELFIFTKHRFNTSSVSLTGKAYQEGYFDIPPLLQKTLERYESLP